MIDFVLKTVQKFNMIQKNDSIIIGVSGGADSVCLLHIMKSISYLYNLQLAAVHINHCIRGKESDDDEKYVIKLCSELNIPLFRFSVDIKSKAKNLSISEEEAGRIFRYSCFEKVCTEFKNPKIAVAHNKNDNAETIIMRFIRGSAIKGLCGIPPVRRNIIRPLIEADRNTIENYCYENNLDFRTDSTNLSDIYTRNKIRLKLIPWIAQNMNSNIINSIVKNASIISEEENFLEQLSDDAFYQCVMNQNFDKEVILNPYKLLEFSDVLKRRIIRKACRFFSEDLHDISYNHINNVINLANGENGKFLRLPSSVCVEKIYGGIRFFRFDEKIYFYSKQPLSFSYDLMYNKIIKIIETGDTVVVSDYDSSYFFDKKPYFILYINKYKIIGTLKVRNRINGDKIFINGVGNKKLKNIFSERKIDAKKRPYIPIVCDDENVISAIGLKISDLYKYSYNDLTNEKINIYFWRTDVL